MRRNNKRDAILEAALQVVENEGANHLTIDAVAAKAGLSAKRRSWRNQTIVASLAVRRPPRLGTMMGHR